MAFTIRQFVNRHNIRMAVDWADENPNIVDESRDHHRSTGVSMNHFKVCLKHNGRQYTTYFSQGYAISGEPKVDDVLDCLAADAAGIENARSFEEWAAEYGYDTDSRKAEKTFHACEKQAERLKTLLGKELYNQLLWEVERE